MSDAFVMIDLEGKSVSVTVTRHGDLVFSSENSPFRITQNQLGDLMDWVEIPKMP